MRLLFVLYFSAISSLAFCQELIPNNSFDKAEGAFAAYWQAFSLTPDYFVSTDTSSKVIIGGFHSFLKKGERTTLIGYQVGQNHTEGFLTQLKKPLERGKKYRIVARVLLSNSCRSGLECITLGLTQYPLKKSIKSPIPYYLDALELKVSGGNIPGQAWSEVRAIYIAEGGERFLSVGNFSQKNASFILKKEEAVLDNGGVQACYYIFMDSISMQEVEEEIVFEIGDILFETGKSALKADALNALEEVVKQIRSAITPIRVVGHTDDVGSAVSNQVLSEKRAEAVRQYLIQSGIPESRVKAVGKGASSPKYSNDSPLGRQKNRRVEIIVY
jgi:OOP family OmpA-OmpF porin